AAAAYVGAARCAGCHAAQSAAWRGSHHDRAMQVASAETVLGDVGGARHDYEGPYTFGADPLQQLLVAFPGGRLQALGIAWDSRPRALGGQRWFHLHPGERVPPDDVLHWTKAA